MPQLPVELIYHVIRQCSDGPTLYSLLFVSRSVHTEAEQLFYRAIRLVDHTDEDYLQAKLENLLDRIIASKDRLARFVEELAITTPFIYGSPNSPPSPVILLIGRILTKLVNLKDLSIICTGIMVDDSPIFIGDIPFLLNALRYHSIPLLPSLFLQFLTTQTNIQRLLLPKLGFLPILPTTIPHLRVLETDHRVVNQIVPGRHITHLKVRTVAREYATHPENIFDDVKVFSCFGKLDIIFELAARMPELLCLDLSTDESPMSMLRHFRALKDKAPKLRSINLGGSGVCPESGSTSHVAMQCFKMFPDLQHVDYQVSVPREYGRWYRESMWWPVFFRRPEDWDWAAGWDKA